MNDLMKALLIVAGMTAGLVIPITAMAGTDCTAARLSIPNIPVASLR